MNVATLTRAPAGHHIVLPGERPGGEPVLSVLLKRSYDIVPGAACTRAAVDQPLVPGDQFWDSPMNSSVRHESDFVPWKLGTDVVLNGHVHAPGGRPAQACRASLQVGDRLKRLWVQGDRVARHVPDGTPLFTEPQPFQALPLRYELAYGGTDVHSDRRGAFAYPRNPTGRGFVVANTPQAVNDLPLPNIEDPDDLLTPERLCTGDYARWAGQPAPAGLGWTGKTWMHRCGLAGVMPGDRAAERQMREAYAALVPAEQREAWRSNGLPEMDFRFFQGAAPGLAMPFLAGDEWLRSENLDPEGTLDFALPGERPAIALDIGHGDAAPEVVLHTVMVRMDERQVDLVWRAALAYPGRDWLPKLRRLHVSVD
jgi:hypothetical protein